MHTPDLIEIKLHDIPARLASKIKNSPSFIFEFLLCTIRTEGRKAVVGLKLEPNGAKKEREKIEQKELQWPLWDSNP